MAGQINRETSMGNLLHQLAVRPEFRTFVEIGTWNGEGSTACFMEGLLTRNDGSLLYSLEADEKMHQTACAFWKNKAAAGGGKLNLLYGRILASEEIMSRQEVVADPLFPKMRSISIFTIKTIRRTTERPPTCFRRCLWKLMSSSSTAENFPPIGEFRKLKNRTKVIVLDDTAVMKCSRARKELLRDESFSILIDDLNERHGILVAARLDAAKHLTQLQYSPARKLPLIDLVGNRLRRLNPSLFSIRQEILRPR